MLLDNLIGISLEKIPPHPDRIKRLLHAAQRNIMDSKIDLVSAENRFDAAYKAIMQLANAALQAHGTRVSVIPANVHYCPGKGSEFHGRGRL